MRLPGLEEKYEILHSLGEGGMGIVYLALQKRINRKVAIKSIAPYLAQDPTVRERFASEAAVLARLNHPNIVTLYDYIEEENALYLIMEYVEGQSLAELLKAGPLPLDLIEKYFTQVLEAFQYAHEEGVIHRDIKPANVMITPGGRVKILDFGVARLLQTDHSLTRTGMRLGTLLYMSPEQVKGEKDITVRSDIYSLGVLLYELLTGKPPYPTDMSEFDLSLKIVKEPLFDLSRPPAEIPARLVEVILKATEKDPAYRYPSCKAFLEEFQAAFGGERSWTAPATRVLSETEKPPRRRFPWVPAAIGLGIAGLGVGLWWLFGPSTQEGEKGLINPESFKPVSETLNVVIAPPIAPARSAPSILPSERPPSSPPSRRRPSQELSSEPASTPAAPSAEPPTAPTGPQLVAQIEDFRRTTFLETKALLQVRNTGTESSSPTRVVVYLLNKAGEVKRTDTLLVPSVAPASTWSKPLRYMVAGVHGLRAQIAE
ncbi:MAG: serine/threonine protein kinase [Bacteroidetes bacterium]|nr:MAG: serine/threonine protein kinase [Bacteroidota bacterium]